MRTPYRLLMLAATVLATGCASIAPPPAMLRSGAEARGCAEWFATLDQAIDQAGVRDAGAHRIPGHPYLRVDRFTAAIRPAIEPQGPAFDAWALRLRALDFTAREAELRNLPPLQLAPLAASAAEALHKAAECGGAMQREDLASAPGRERLAQLAVVPDDYARWVHATGVYAVARWPFSLGVEGWHREADAMFHDAANGKATHSNIRRVEPAGAEVSADQVRTVLARTRRDALGVPVFSPEDEALLFRAYAPRYEIESTGDFDRFGALVWNGGAAPQVDPAQPRVYKRLAYTRFHGRVLPQLVYTLWFPERPSQRRMDLLAGHLDGLVMRVTLADDGTPLVWDTIHPCGCYHMFFPTAALRSLPPPDPKEEWAFVPATLPAMAAAERVAVKTATATHYLVGVRPATPDAATPVAETYTLVDEDGLRRLPLPGGGSRSIYGPDALVRGSERLERLLFWPMGIASPGTMRQWGRHPTAFLGRRSFDQADLIEQRFALAAAAP